MVKLHRKQIDSLASGLPRPKYRTRESKRIFIKKKTSKNKTNE